MTKFDGREADQHLPEGLYELLSTTGLSGLLDKDPGLELTVGDVDTDDTPEVLSRHIAEAARRALAEATPADRVTMANRLLQELNSKDLVAPGPSQIQSLHRPDTLKRRQLRRPTTKLSDSALLTNSKNEPNPAAELRAEMESADTVELLCAFIRWTGLRLLQPALEGLKEPAPN